MKLRRLLKGRVERLELNLDVRRAKALGDWRVLRVAFGVLFDNLVDEGICGRFGSIRWIGRLYIGSLGFRPDDRSVSFTVLRLFVPDGT